MKKKRFIFKWLVLLSVILALTAVAYAIKLVAGMNSPAYNFVLALAGIALMYAGIFYFGERNKRRQYAEHRRKVFET